MNDHRRSTKRSFRESIDLWLRMYRQMVAIRQFEAQVNELYTRALMPGLAHLYIGEEAVAVGVCEALERTDYITSTHRGHGHCLAKGASPDRMFAELLGKEGRVLQRQRRFHAHCGPGNRQSRSECDRMRQRRHCDRSGIFRAALWATAAWLCVFSEKARSGKACCMKR